MAGVIWHVLELEGFGRYRGRVTAEFQDGINTIIGQNETGKSTLVAGLSAVVFGLPNNSSPEAFGNRRFRNWDGPVNFSGRVEFSVGGQRYRITRQFDRNVITLDTYALNAWQALVRGEHNPGATKRNEAYEQKLHELLGVRSRELFEQTFCVGQPMPDGAEVDGKVQELLAGAGGGLEGALKGLLERLRKVTKLNTSYGVGERDARLDGRLDTLRQEVVGAEETLRSQGESLDRLHVEQAELDAALEKRRATESALREKRATAAAWTEWQGKRSAYEAAVRAKTLLTRAQEAARTRRVEIDELGRRIRQNYAAFEGQAEDTGDRLATLAALERQAAERSKEMDALSAQLREDETALREAEVRLVGELAGVRGRPDLPAQLGALRRVSGQLRELRVALAAARATAEEAKATLGGMRPWSKLGGSPVQVLHSARSRAAEVLPAWARLTGFAARASQFEQTLQSDYGLFQAADEDTLKVITRYEATLERLQQEAAAAAGDLAQLESAAAHYRQEERAIDDEFADLDGLGADFGHAAQAKIALLEEKYVLEKAVAAAAPVGRAGGGRAVLVGSLVAVVGFAATLGVKAVVPAGGGGASGISPATLGLAAIVAVLSGLAAFLVTQIVAGAGRRSGGRSGRRAGDRTAEQTGGQTGEQTGQAGQATDAQTGQAQARLIELQKQIDALNPTLRTYADAGAAVLTQVITRLSTREARRSALHSQVSAIPGFDRLGDVSARSQQAQSSLDAFLRLVASFREAYSNDPAQAYRNWELVKNEHRRVRTQLEETAQALGVSPDDPARTSTAGKPPFESLLSLAEMCGARADTVGQLVEWLESLSPAWWEEAAAEARGYEAAAVRLRDAQNRLHVLSGEEAGGAGGAAEERLAAELADLQERVAPYTEETDPEDVKTLVQQAQALEQEKVGRSTSVTKNRQRLERLAAEHQHQAEEARSLETGLATPLAAATGSVSKTLELWQAYLPISRRRAALEQELEGILQGQGMTDEETLANRLTDAEARMGAALMEWKALVSARSGLPPADGSYDFEDLARRQVALEQEINGLAGDLVRYEDLVEGLRQEVSTLKAKNLENLAQLQEKLERNRQQVKEQEMEARALGMAYTELDAARRDYQASYRGLLADRATAHFAELSGVADRRVLVDEDFKVALTVPEGECAVAQLSQGARDQLYLALRLAVADLLARDVQLPFVFDDPFLSCDQARMERIRSTLDRLAAERQIILLSHRPELASWGTPVCLAGDGAIEATA